MEETWDKHIFVMKASFFGIDDLEHQAERIKYISCGN